MGLRRSEQALTLLRHPRRSLEILWARLLGRRLRARTLLAGLVGIEHRIALPARLIRHGAAADPPFADDAILLLGAPSHRLVADAGRRIRAAFADPDLQALYGDALVQTRRGDPLRPVLRPVFDPDFLAEVDYIGPVVALRRAALAEAGVDPRAGATEAMFRIAERFGPGAVGHLPAVLSVWQPWTAAGEGGTQAHRAAVRAHLDRTGASAVLAEEGEGLALLRPLPEPLPLASIIVPTRDRLDLLRPCVESILARTDWPALELLICDNGSTDPATLAYLRDLQAKDRARVVPFPGPFDFAAMNNAAAAAARGRLLVFVNNDVEVHEPGWLRLMARQALRPEVGAVGAKLIDRAGRIQHGGCVLGTGGLVTHAYRHFPGNAPGHLGDLTATHAVSAVTAACLMVEAAKFAQVHGFDGTHFAVDFNDVDLCLRLRTAGYRTLMVPRAVLSHYEATSRRWTPEARARHAREVEALRRRWGPLLAQDPHYHPGFDPDLSTHARLRPGWLLSEPEPVRRARY